MRSVDPRLGARRPSPRAPASTARPTGSPSNPQKSSATSRSSARPTERTAASESSLRAETAYEAVRAGPEVARPPADPASADEGTRAVKDALALAQRGTGPDLVELRTRGPSFVKAGEVVAGRIRRATEHGRPMAEVELPEGRRFKLSPQDVLGAPDGGRITLRRDGQGRLLVDPEGTDAVTSFVGKVERAGGKLVAVSSSPTAPFPKIRLAEAATAQVGDEVLVHVVDGLTSARYGLVEAVLPPSEPWRSTLTRLAVDLGVEATFSPEVKEDVERIKALFDPDRIEGYQDLTEKYFFSIDNPYSRDFDQAMCIEPSRSTPGAHDVYYAIADLDYFLRLAGPDSALAERAHRVQTTTYMPGLDFPVLPRELSEDLCSLVEGERRPALVIKFTVGPDAAVGPPELIDGIIVNRRNGSYPEAQAHLDGTPVSDALYARGIEALKDVGGRLLDAAEKRGMFIGQPGERWASLDPSTGKLSFEQRGHLFIEAANAQISITANRLIGEHLIAAGAPAFHRVHEDPEPRRVALARAVVERLGVKWRPDESPQDLLKRLDATSPLGRAVRRTAQRVLPRAFVSAEPGSHHGLKVETYVQSTAPMRRTRDAQNHAWSRAVRDGRAPDAAGLEEAVDRARSAEDRSRRVDREVRARIAAALLAEHRGEKLEAEVIGIAPWGVDLHFPSVGVDFTLPFREMGLGRFRLSDKGTVASAGRTRFELAQTITAEVLDAEPQDGKVRFAFAASGADAAARADRAEATRRARGAERVLDLAEVRGDGFESPLVGERVQTRGVVSAVNGVGFFIQPESAPGSITGGLLVRTRDAGGVAPGDVVEVDAKVIEKRKADAPYDRSVVELVQASFRVTQKGEAPAPVELGSPGVGPVPADREAAIEYWRALLGQRVRVPSGTAVSPSNRFGDLVVIPGGWPVEGALRTEEGGVVMPDGHWNHQNIGLKLRREVGPLDSVSVGDRLGEADGVVIYRSGSFQVELAEAPALEKGPERPAPEARLVAEPGKLVVAGVNALNMHPGEATRAERLAERIVHQLKAPDVIALQEIQDNDGPQKSSEVDASETYAMIVRAIEAAGGPRYEWFDIPPENGQDGGQPGGNIRNGFLYRQDRVKVDLDGVERVGEGDPAFDRSRKSLAATFEMGGRRLLIVNNHLASRRGSSPWTADLEIPVVGKEAERRGQAERLFAYVEERRAADPNLDVLFIGDMNDGTSSPTVERLTRDGFRDLTLEVPPNERFDYNYRGTLQVLQPVIQSPELTGRTEIEILHDSVFNGIKDSDHDPVLVRIDMTPPARPLAETVASPAPTSSRRGPARGKPPLNSE